MRPRLQKGLVVGRAAGVLILAFLALVAVGVAFRKTYETRVEREVARSVVRSPAPGPLVQQCSALTIELYEEELKAYGQFNPAEIRLIGIRICRELDRQGLLERKPLDTKRMIRVASRVVREMQAGEELPAPTR